MAIVNTGMPAWMKAHVPQMRRNKEPALGILYKVHEQAHMRSGTCPLTHATMPKVGKGIKVNK
jgi:hypothetical protein